MTQVALVAYPGLTALDLIGPYEVLRMLPGADVRFVWHEVGPVTADSGVLMLGATHTFAETPRPAIVVVPGGSTTVMNQAHDDVLLDWLRSVHQHTSWTTSVCAGSMILGAAGLLQGRRATSHWQALQALRAFGATPVGDERVVHDGDIVTAAGVSAGIDLALWIAAKVAGEQRAKAIQLVIEYDPQPPFDSGSTAKSSTTTVARATALLARDSVTPAHLSATARVLWQAAIDRARMGRRRK
ncbi:DJ-1/PfpI family protein [Gordonia sp. LSe1-13]|uniref:DJ-1/PfpI family protein n=1 Tax=Gordonia sesuvii TaxID=3116777 RepID=A0ABU7M8B6_9ACTN|nr:DJ-1/PfpI family protein [Gordonia sp. LSe1-13]